MLNEEAANMIGNSQKIVNDIVQNTIGDSSKWITVEESQTMLCILLADIAVSLQKISERR